jgi:hypothetical protein
MPARLEAAGIPRVSAARCRQLAEQDPDWPIPLSSAQKIGRVRLFDWTILEPYFRGRQSRQGQRTDRMKAEPQAKAARAAYDRKELLIVTHLPRCDDEPDQAASELFNELTDRVRAVVTDERYEGLAPRLDMPE